MRAVKDSFPLPYGESEESEELESIHAVKLTQSPCLEEVLHE